MTRGAASVLGRGNLAAVAKGREAGAAQVVPWIDAMAKDAEECLVGHAHAIDYPEINTIDLLRARL